MSKKAPPKPAAPVAAPQSKPSQHRLFANMFRTMLLENCESFSVPKEKAHAHLPNLSDDDLCEIGAACGCDDEHEPQAATHTDPTTGEMLGMATDGPAATVHVRGGPLKNIIERLKDIPPETKQKMIETALKLLGLLV